MTDSETVEDPQKVEEDAEEEEHDAAEYWMQLGTRMRLLRELERQDSAERQPERQSDTDEPETRCPPQGCRSSLILDYDWWLQGDQRYHDDYKHVDYCYIDFGVHSWRQALHATCTDRRPLIIQQDKSLGKGGFCWDAAFILGEYVASRPLESSSRVIELGSGTGLCT
jgi:hypothetical protein